MPSSTLPRSSGNPIWGHRLSSANTCPRFPTEVRATAVGFCFHQGAIWGGLIAPLLAYYASSRNIPLSGPILVTTVVGLAVFVVAVLLSPETKGKVLVAELTVA